MYSLEITKGLGIARCGEVRGVNRLAICLYLRVTGNSKDRKNFRSTYVGRLRITYGSRRGC